MIEPPHKISLIRGIVAVAAPHGDTRAPRRGVVEHAKPAVMAVDDAPLWVGGKQRPQFTQVAGQIVVLPDGQLEDAPAQRTDFIVKKARLIVMIEKIELNLLPGSRRMGCFQSG